MYVRPALITTENTRTIHTKYTRNSNILNEITKRTIYRLRAVKAIKTAITKLITRANKKELFSSEITLSVKLRNETKDVYTILCIKPL